MAKLAKLSDDNYLFLLVASLRGRAKEWFTYTSRDIETWTLPEFKSRLNTRFPATDHERKLLEKFQRTQEVKSKTELQFVTKKMHTDE